MTIGEMQSKIDQYEKALDEVLVELCNQVIKRRRRERRGRFSDGERFLQP
jgi:hypothetical protein